MVGSAMEKQVKEMASFLLQILTFIIVISEKQSHFRNSDAKLDKAVIHIKENLGF